MGENIKRLSVEASNMKTILLQNNNIDILLYLAKYNPNVTTKEIEEKFGKDSAEGLKGLMSFNLVKEENCNLTLTEEGIFQVEGLLTLAA
ncbi:MAG: hypothetical protein FJY76_02135 [Candidatus Aenigmarchaeota archaeon]|nr:hypothetical protein [Candidatus Aenigmarchaeota archaeon]